MAILRTVQCGICGVTYTEKQHPNDGFPNWGQLSGAVLDGDANPYLCPNHMSAMFDYADKLKNGISIFIPKVG